MLIEAERKELSLNPSTFASPIGQLSDHRMAERKVQNWPTEDLKWVLDQVMHNVIFCLPHAQVLNSTSFSRSFPYDIFLIRTFEHL